MSKIHSVRSSDGTICVVVDGKHHSISIEHPSHQRFMKHVKTCTKNGQPLDEELVTSMFDINQAVECVLDGKVKIDLSAGKVEYDGMQVEDKAFCTRILRLVSEGHDVQFLINFLKNMKQNPEPRAVLETFNFISNKGMPITPDGCFLGYKGVSDTFYDKWTGKINNFPDGRRVEEPRETLCNDPDQCCAKGLHLGSIEYGRDWAGYDGHVILVKVNPKDVVSVPSSDCQKMRTCGYWVLKEFGKDKDVLIGEVYDSSGNPIDGNTFNRLDLKGELDNVTNSHWDEDEGRTYTDSMDTVEDDYEEMCEDCSCTVEDCMCEDFCPDCEEDYSDCECE